MLTSDRNKEVEFSLTCSQERSRGYLLKEHYFTREVLHEQTIHVILHTYLVIPWLRPHIVSWKVSGPVNEVKLKKINNVLNQNQSFAFFTASWNRLDKMKETMLTLLL